MRRLFLFLILFAFISIFGNNIKIEKKIYLKGLSYSIKGTYKGKEDLSIKYGENFIKIPVDTEGKFQTQPINLNNSVLIFKEGNKIVKYPIKLINPFLSVIPPLIALILAFWLKDVFMALFLGVFSGLLIIYDYNIFKSFYAMFNDLLIKVLSSPGHIKIILFTISMGGLILLMRKAGGIDDLVNRVTRHIDTPRKGMLATFFAGLIIFFDDYANALMIGNAVRPLTDKLRISREKLSFLIDGTSAPVASIAPISTWIGYEISVIVAAYATLDVPQISGYVLFFKTYPYRFYTILMLFFTFFIALLDRDFGPMYEAEKRTRIHNKPLADDAKPMTDKDISTEKESNAKWYFAIIPILTVLFTIIFMLFYTGFQNYGWNNFWKEFSNSSFFSKITAIINLLGASSTSSSLVLGPPAGILVFIILAKIKKVFSIKKSVSILVAGAKFVLFAVFIITLAWSIGKICRELDTAKFFVSLLGDNISARFLPLISFIISGLIAFATGTSYGTMAIMFPIIIPLSYELGNFQGLEQAFVLKLLYASMGSVLAGACFGDHCSPISDTTLFSSLSAGADHLHHVKTQLPYAVSVAIISAVFGYLLIGLGVSVILALIISIIATFLTIIILGKKNPQIYED